MSEYVVVTLEIQNWTGVSFGAVHYYGKLVGYTKDGEYKKVEIKGKLSEAQARSLNKLDSWTGWKKGDLSGRFADEDRLIAEAKAIWRNAFPDARLLVRGLFVASMPREPLDCDDPDILQQAKAIFTEADQVGWYKTEESSDRMETIYQAWVALLDSLTAQERTP